jgi:hypothetical protein
LLSQSVLECAEDIVLLLQAHATAQLETFFMRHAQKGPSDFEALSRATIKQGPSNLAAVRVQQHCNCSSLPAACAIGTVSLGAYGRLIVGSNAGRGRTLGSLKKCDTPVTTAAITSTNSAPYVWCFATERQSTPQQPLLLFLRRVEDPADISIAFPMVSRDTPEAGGLLLLLLWQEVSGRPASVGATAESS